ncbi:HET-domain-containing protein [Hypoxylon rubiginosum]|uniref:HET-domain-containing protein n=1 Tax=Hypoxylon rubiginosum TaxID=110542 RepID=A0ACC0CQX7_9PEZI|nr:HET-domain-containing protein [Hypoxylon rubiginosum]
MSTDSSPRAPSPHQGSREGVYAPFNRARREIRVIELLPGADEQPVECALHTESLDADVHVRYAALSYVWGDPQVTEDIVVNGRRLPVTANLASALWHFRKYGFPRRSRSEQTDEIRRLWVDAVCINQHDTPEKNSQVHMMGSIYSGAAAVISWLGPPGPGRRLDRALRVIRDVAPVLGAAEEECSSPDPLEGRFKAVNEWSSSDDQETERRLKWLRDDLNHLVRLPRTERVWYLKVLRYPDVTNPHYDILKSLVEMVMAVLEKLVGRLGPVKDSAGRLSENWEPIRALHENEYWERLWIVQEMALARSPRSHWFVCGGEAVTFRELEAFDFFFEYARSTPYPGSLDDIYIEQRSSWQSLRAIENIPTLDMVKIFQWVLRGETARTPTREQWQSLTLFEAAVLAAPHARAREPRDAVYAVLSLSHDSNVVPDYDKPVRDVYIEAAVGNGDDDLMRNIFPCLGYAGRGIMAENEHGLPSWVLDLPTLSERRLFMLNDVRPGKKEVLGTVEVQPPSIIKGDVLGIQGAVCGRVKLVRRIEFAYDRPSINTALYRLAVDYLVEFAGADRLAGRRPLQELINVLDWAKKGSRGMIETLRGYTGPLMSTVWWCFLTVVLLEAIDVAEPDKAEAARRLGVPAESAHLLLGNCLTDLDRCDFDPEIPIGDEQEILRRDFADMVKSCVSRTLFLTDRGQLGLGPRYMQQGDLVCAVDRLTLPILLREVESPGLDGSSHLEHIGTCYVSGLSDGEPAEMIRNGELQIQTFEIH